MEQLQRLLKDFSKVSRIHFAIGDGKELMVTVHPDKSNGHLDESLRNFSARVLGEGGFRTEPIGPYDIYGTPIRVGDASAIALVAYKEKDPGMSRVPADTQAGNMKNFVSGLSQLIQQYWSALRDSEKMADELAEGFETISLYSRITPQIASFTFSDGMFRGLAEDLLETMRADLIFTRMPSRDELSQVAETGQLTSIVENTRNFLVDLVNAIPSDAPSLKDHYFVINDSRDDEAYGKLHNAPFRFLAAAIEHQANSYGWLGVVSFNMKEIFRLSELRMMTTVAKQIAIAISNVDLYVELDRFVVNVVRSLVYAIEAKDTYTKGHSERVSQYCMKMADELRFSKEEKRTLFWSSILHDVGKIGISEEILKKPGALTGEEFEEIKTHPEKGYKILKPLNQLTASLENILYHHERYDGTGYPEGLKGGEIPLQARIIAVADTFDAITSDRSYRSHKSPEQALAIMEDVAGKQLDPHLVRIFKTVCIDSATSGAEEILFVP